MVRISELPNGLTLIVEEVPHVSSVAYSLMIPGGVVHDAEETLGASLILAELTSRGAGEYDSRALSERFDALGVRHSETIGSDSFLYNGFLLADELSEVLELVSLMVLEPRLPADEIESIADLFSQDIRSLEDNPANKAMIKLREKYYPTPYGRSTLGTLTGLKNTTLEILKAEWQEKYHPRGAVLSIVGNVKCAEVETLVHRYFGAWQGSCVQKIPFGTPAKGAYHHIESDSAQLQITFASPSAPFCDENYYAAKVASGILSGGMFGRLFVEVREKLGLCYSVYAGHSATKEYGTLSAYAGTVPERADKTLEVMLREMKGLKGTVTQEELDRAKANILAGYVIGEESIPARASSYASDWWIIKRVRSREEITQAYNQVTLADIDNYCERFPIADYSVLTLGSRRLDHIF